MKTGVWTIKLDRTGRLRDCRKSDEEKITGGTKDYEDCILVGESPGGYNIKHDGDFSGSCLETENVLLIDTDTFTGGRT